MSGGRIEVTFVADYLATGGAERHAVTSRTDWTGPDSTCLFLRLKPGGALEALLDMPGLARLRLRDVARKSTSMPLPALPGISRRATAA